MAYPQFKAPKWQTSRISALRQQFAAPQVGRLKRKMSGWMGMGYDPQSMQARRSAIRGYGEGLGGIMTGAGQLALGQYGQEYGTQFKTAQIQHGTAERESERRWARGPLYGSWLQTGRRPIRGRGLGGGGRGMVKGGNVKGKKPYLVGEEGPELFIPDSKGMIIPNPKTQIGMKSKSLYIPRRYGGTVSAEELEERLTKAEILKRAKKAQQVSRAEREATRLYGGRHIPGGSTWAGRRRKTTGRGGRRKGPNWALRQKLTRKRLQDELAGFGRGGGEFGKIRGQQGESDFLRTYLGGIKTSPGPGFGQRMGSWMLKAQPSKYFNILKNLQRGPQRRR